MNDEKRIPPTGAQSEDKTADCETASAPVEESINLDSAEISEEIGNGDLLCDEKVKEADSEDVQTAPDKTQKKKKNGLTASIFEVLEMFVACAAVVILCFTFVARVTVVKGPSMQNTLVAGDCLVVHTLGYKLQRGDIIVLQDPEAKSYTDPLVKRLIAVAGDVVDIDDHIEMDADGKVKYVFTVTVNGEVIDESEYLHLDEENYSNLSRGSYPITVEEGKIFVMGDNRYHSADSRASAIGQIDERCVIGHAVMRLYPFGRIKIFN